MRAPLPDAVVAWAERQQGVLARSQLVAFGLRDCQTARLVRQQVLTKLDRSVYVLGTPPPTWHQYAWAAVLVGGRGSRLMGTSAGAIEGLCEPALPIQLAVPPSSGLGTRPWLRVVRASPGVRAAGWVGAPARTLVEDTVLDMCATAAGAAEVIGILTTSCQRLTTSRRLLRALGRRARVAHRQLITDVLTDVADGARSPLEFRWIHDVERPHGLPVPIRQYRLPGGQIADGAYEQFKVLLELDGRAHHDGARRFRDWRRDNLSSEDDWLTLRYGWHDTVVRPCATAGNLSRVLRRRGWDGRLTRCRSCPA